MILLINYSHKWWYKVLSVLLIVALILAISFGTAPRAHAVGMLTMTVCAAILAVMAGAGIATVVSGMTSNDIQSWMQSKLEEWDLYRNDGNIFSDLIQNNLITATVKGTLAIGNAAARGISDFIDWLIDDLSITDNSSNEIINNVGTFSLLSLFPNFSNYGLSINNNIITRGNSPYSGYMSSNNVYNCNFNIIGNFVGSNPNRFSIAVDLVSSISGNSINISDYPNDVVIDFNSFRIYKSVAKYSDYNFQIFVHVEGLISGLAFDMQNAGDNSSITVSNMYIDGIKYGSNDSSLSLDTDVINIPSVADDGQTDIIIGIDGVYPGATTDEAADVIMDGVLDNTLDTTMTVTDEYVDAVEAVVINEQPISVNTDHHMIGFTNLPDFVNLNLNSIWHYVSDAVEYASGFISWFVNLLSSVPTLAIPLYMSFTLLIVLSFIRRILL